jgi:hypothetical protein
MTARLHLLVDPNQRIDPPSRSPFQPQMNDLHSVIADRLSNATTAMFAETIF